MFYVCEQKDYKFGVKDTRDNVVEYYTADELNRFKEDLGIKVFGHWDGTWNIMDVDEYQELKWNDLTIFSFFNKTNKSIYTWVENGNKSNILYFNSDKGYVDDYEVVSKSKHRNGDLECIFMEGRDTKCVGYTIWLNYMSDNRSEFICMETYLEYRPDGKVYEIENTGWDFNECSGEYVYDSRNDCIDYSYRY